MTTFDLRHCRVLLVTLTLISIHTQTSAKPLNWIDPQIPSALAPFADRVDALATLAEDNILIYQHQFLYHLDLNAHAQIIAIQHPLVCGMFHHNTRKDSDSSKYYDSLSLFAFVELLPQTYPCNLDVCSCGRDSRVLGIFYH